MPRSEQRKLRVGILGSSGMIGRCLVELCSDRGDEVRLASRTPVSSCYHLDLASRSGSPSRFLDGLDVVYNCAGVMGGDDLYTVNVAGVEWLARKAEKFDAAWIQLSSAGLYAENEGLVNESSSIAPNSDYEKTKFYADQILESSHIHSVFVRPTTVLGRGMKSRWSMKLVDSILNKRFCYLGRKDGAINAVAATDVAKAMVVLASADYESNATYLINNPRSVQHFVDRIVSAFGHGLATFPVVPYAVARTFASIPFLPKLTGLTADAVNFVSGRTYFDPTLFVDKYMFDYDSDPAELAIELYREGI